MTISQMNFLVHPAKTASKSPLKTKTESRQILYRCMIFYRFVLATVGGYILASLSAIVIAQVFIGHKSSAAMSATLIAFCLHCAAFIWVFMVNKTLKASLGILLPSVILFMIYKSLGN